MGELIAERYELEELVGTGGMSSVYRAHDRLLERDVALKVLHQQFLSDGEQVERFRREARAVAQLSHPNIVTVIDRGEQDGRQYIVFEYVDGENLKALVEREGPLPERDAIELALQVARALGFAHEQGLVHRDVKPQNVLLNDGGDTKVTDFGIARSLDVQGGLTQTGTVMGTSDYIAPEQARGSRVDAQSDVYSLGAVLYELLTGEVPFKGDNFVAVAMRHINEPPPSVREHRPELSPCVDAVVRRAMAKEPRDRFRSMNELCVELTDCLAQLDGAATSSAAETMVVAPQRRRRGSRPPRAPAERPSVWPLILLLAGLAVLAGILAAVFAFTDSGQRIKEAVGAKKSGAAGKNVTLSGVAAYDPFGDQHEHDEDVRLATDRNPATFWTTEHYQSFTKEGVGLVLDAGAVKKLSKVTVHSDTPGFTAEIESGSSSSGPFTPVSGSATVGGSTDFSLGGQAARYYVVWITDLGGHDAVQLTEVSAKS
ncbi:MAG TPA: protein kinase [Gaiellaceae bacterium]|nr:protein kinase [Gaiellaceae bacterium]